MSFIKQTFDIKKLVRNLDEAPAIPDKLAAKEQAEATSADLSEYVYQRLFLPIVQDGSVPLEGLDFNLISEDELDMLYEALENCEVIPLVRMGLVFNSMSPASAGKAKFI